MGCISSFRLDQLLISPCEGGLPSCLPAEKQKRDIAPRRAKNLHFSGVCLLHFTHPGLEHSLRSLIFVSGQFHFLVPAYQGDAALVGLQQHCRGMFMYILWLKSMSLTHPALQRVQSECVLCPVYTHFVPLQITMLVLALGMVVNVTLRASGVNAA